MNTDALLAVFATPYISVAIYGVAVAFAVLASLVPDSVTARRLSIDPVSPLWLVVPALVAAALVASGRGQLLTLTAGGVTVPLLFLLQVLASGWVLWRFRRFPWLVFPLALVLGWIQWMFFLRMSAIG